MTKYLKVGNRQISGTCSGKKQKENIDSIHLVTVDTEEKQKEQDAVVVIDIDSLLCSCKYKIVVFWRK